jgi:hypothetical protein
MLCHQKYIIKLGIRIYQCIRMQRYPSRLTDDVRLFVEGVGEQGDGQQKSHDDESMEQAEDPLAAIGGCLVLGCWRCTPW